MGGVVGIALIAAGVCVHEGVNPPEVLTPLSGPRVETPAPAATLVQTDYNGKVRRVEATPEEAALDLMELKAEDRERAERVLTQRARVLDEVVRENLLLFNQVDTATKAGRKLETLVLMMDLYGKFQPLRDRGLLHDEIEAALPVDQQDDFNDLVGDYWDAIIDEGQRETNADGQRPARVEIVLKERLDIFGREIERSFKRYETTAVEDVLDDVVRGLNLSDDQQRRVAPIINRLAQSIRSEAPEQERGLIIVQMTAFMTAEQTAKLIEAFTRLGR